MKKALSALSILILLALTSLPAAPVTNALAKFQNVHRVVFLGDSITYAGGYIDDIEAYYDTRFPDREIDFINLGLSSETVSGLSEKGHAGGKFPRPDLHERLGRVLEKTKPDLVFICYGMNDGIYQPFDQSRFKAFRDGLKSVHEQIAATSAKVIHITPPIFDAQGAAARATNAGPFGFSHPYFGYDEVLALYSDWLLDQRDAGWDVVDLHTPMKRWLLDHREKDADFSYTREGVHPDAAGHWVMAKQILLYLGASDVADMNSESELVSGNPHGAEILKLVREKQQLLRDAWLNFAGFKRPGVKPGLPVPEAEAKAGELDKQIRELVKQPGGTAQ